MKLRFPVVVIALLSIAVSGTGVLAAPVAGWSAFWQPATCGLHNDLYGVSALSSSDIWAVGICSGAYSWEPTVYNPMAEHWDGTTWTMITMPSVAKAVVAIAKNDVWAVGADGVFHWNGSSWTFDQSVNGSSISAVGSNDIWVAGGSGLFYWNGSSWRSVPAPTSSFDGISAISQNDVWAISGVKLWHRLGSSWHEAVNPAARGSLSSIFAISRKDVWAVGTLNGSSLAENWNGHQWIVTNTLGISGAAFSSVTGLPNGTAWAVGTHPCSDYCGLNGMLIEQWDGTSWHVAPLSFPQDYLITGTVYPTEVTSVATSGQAWAVGIFDLAPGFGPGCCSMTYPFMLSTVPSQGPY